MAYEGPQIKLPGLVAGADLSAAGNQYKFVKYSADNTVVLCAAATDKPCGVLQNRPANGEAAEVVAIGVTKVQADAALSAGAAIGTSADGQADAKTVGTDTTEYIVGQVQRGASAAAALATALVNCASPARAA